ncbi:MAG: TRAP transporter small permease [Tissierellia bacterium]|nr:TRAP transporter small permease [Tissierellia bacterium]
MKKSRQMFSRIIDQFLLIFLGGMTFIITLQIITRYVFYYSLPWSEELSRYLFAYLILIGASVGVRNGQQISIDLIDSTSIGKTTAIRVLQLAFQMITVIILIVSSIQLVKNGANQLSPAMRVPMNLVYLALPIGYILILFELALKLRDLFYAGRISKIEKSEGGSE